jgi:diacylglycerol kinase (ATP)
MTNPHKGCTGLARVVRAAGHSTRGLRGTWIGERGFRQEAVLAIVLLPAAFYVGGSWIEVALLAGSVLIVLIVELLNSAIETTVDRVSLESHDLSRRAKDLSSAAVMFALILCGGVWLAALWNQLRA